MGAQFILFALLYYVSVQQGLTKSISTKAGCPENDIKIFAIRPVFYLQKLRTCYESLGGLSAAQISNVIDEFYSLTPAEAELCPYLMPSMLYTCKSGVFYAYRAILKGTGREGLKIKMDPLKAAATNSLECFSANRKKLLSSRGMTEEKLKDMTCQQVKELVGPCPANEKDPDTQKHHCVFATMMFDATVAGERRLASCKYECGSARERIAKVLGTTVKISP